MGDKTDAPLDVEIDAFQTATKDLVGVTLRSLELLEGRVSLPQFRVLVVLADLGISPSSSVARELGMNASSVTRLADRLEASGHVVRGHDPRSRSIVTLALTPAGRRLVDQVMRWRRDELARILGRLSPSERAVLAAALHRFHEAVGRDGADEPHGPVPL
ncbi:MarR family winged helix-turn-helix transcriptional regulator [Actinoallomurus sp. CA-150999]|uniref:MarR family winged helix-turn-helix transcriptional regulator n=1 Tax=Actinoallomurus sp. CA-150999 TaxID=3239887 RepID=UPI003D8E7B41